MNSGYGQWFLLGAGIFLVPGFFASVMLVAATARKKRLFPARLWNRWERMVETETDENWEQLLKRAGYPFGWRKAEWLATQWAVGGSMFMLVLLWNLWLTSQSFPFISLLLVPSLGYFSPYVLLKLWAGYREDVLSVDIARFINRYVTLLENHVPPYQAMVKAAKPTRKLKDYIPSLSEWNQDRVAALERFKHDLGVDDGVILVSNIRTIQQISPDMLATTMQRLEWTIDNRRMFRHRRKIKSLGIAYSVTVYPAFYMGLILAMFPWYKLLTEILDKYLI